MLTSISSKCFILYKLQKEWKWRKILPISYEHTLEMGNTKDRKNVSNIYLKVTTWSRNTGMNQGQYYLMNDSWDDILNKYRTTQRQNKKQEQRREFNLLKPSGNFTYDQV
jgi:hypothetical protein